jgi:hypothetical protein
MSLINYKVYPIQLKGRKGEVINAELEEFQSVTLPYELINKIYSFMPKHPLVKIVITGIINVKNNRIQLEKGYLNNHIRWVADEKINNPLAYERHRLHYNTIINSISIIPFMREIVKNPKYSKIQCFYIHKKEVNTTIKRLFLDTIRPHYERPPYTTEEKIIHQRQQLKSKQHYPLRLMNLNERNILPQYTRTKKPLKMGLQKNFEKSQKDYFKRKGIKKYKLVEHKKVRTFNNSNRVSILNDVIN